MRYKTTTHLKVLQVRTGPKTGSVILDLSDGTSKVLSREDRIRTLAGNSIPAGEIRVGTIMSPTGARA